jgi:Mrp family chromosome partitioning ATPase
MSRNFELLTQIEPERQLGAVRHRPTAATDRAVENVAAPSDDGDTCSEELLRLVRSVFLSTNGHAARQVVFCGVTGESGSSSVCARVGRALAANGTKSVCVADANVRSHRLSTFFGCNEAISPSDKSASAREQCVPVGDNLWLAGIGLLGDNRGALQSADELKHRIAQLHGSFDYVLIDAPGANISGDAAILGQIVGAAILVVEANSTRRFTARNAKLALEAAGVRLLGSVLHNRTFPIPEKLYRRL